MLTTPGWEGPAQQPWQDLTDALPVTLSAAKGLAHRPLRLLCLSSTPCCHPERSEGSGSTGAEMLRGVYPERSEGLSCRSTIKLGTDNGYFVLKNCKTCNPLKK